MRITEIEDAGLRERLLSEWDAEANGAMPDATVGSRELVHWRCSRGHRWTARLDVRVGLGRGCPVCAGQRVSPGENDLSTVCPELAARWDRERNAPLTPDQVTAGSHRTVWWLCEKGHSYEAPVYIAGRMGCPCCSGKRPIPGETDLASTHPALAAEWDGGKNVSPPESFTAGSSKKVWWLCSKGHSYEAKIYSRAAGTGCPYCTNKKVLRGFNDLATTDPELTREWCRELNGSLTPEKVTRGSAKKVWWRCDEGHVWQTAVFARTREAATGCPICSGRRKTVKTPQPRRHGSIADNTLEVRI